MSDGASNDLREGASRRRLSPREVNPSTPTQHDQSLPLPARAQSQYRTSPNVHGKPQNPVFPYSQQVSPHPYDSRQSYPAYALSPPAHGTGHPSSVFAFSPAYPTHSASQDTRIGYAHSQSSGYSYGHYPHVDARPNYYGHQAGPGSSSVHASFSPNAPLSSYPPSESSLSSGYYGHPSSQIYHHSHPYIHSPYSYSTSYSPTPAAFTPGYIPQPMAFSSPPDWSRSSSSFYDTSSYSNPSDPQATQDPSNNSALHLLAAQSTDRLEKRQNNSPAADSSPAAAAAAKAQEKLPVRKGYHPSPPAQRSDWVMWVGNVPADATHNELWKFFSAAEDEEKSTNPAPSSPTIGFPHRPSLASIFLIARSNCAFVNYEDEESLLSAITNCNGKQLRPSEPRCPKLVCRVRKKDDDLKAGVGAQRGAGIHTTWIRSQKLREHESSIDETILDPGDRPHQTPVQGLPPSIGSPGQSPLSPTQTKGSSSGSFASTNSSFLAQHFPRRFFVLKSLSEQDLDESVKSGLWATQKHNEGVLDQSFRNSQTFLIFGANKTGEFYGYARMTGPVLRNPSVSSASGKLSWTSKSSIARVPEESAEMIPEEATSNSPGVDDATHTMQKLWIAPEEGHIVDASPQPLLSDTSTTDLGQNPPGVQTAPAELGHHKRKPYSRLPSVEHWGTDELPPVPITVESLGGEHKSGGEFELDPMAPLRAAKHPAMLGTPVSGSLHQVDEEAAENEAVIEDAPLTTVPDAADIPGVQEPIGAQEGDRAIWGDSFKIEWISTTKLPFNRTRHLRNPWNHNREIKVSRDGTELEPKIGQALLDQWETLSRDPPEEHNAEHGRGAGGGRFKGRPKDSQPRRNTRS